MVDFTYLQRGIRIRSERYPVVKMQWAQGDPLHMYVQKNLGNPQVLTSLARQWVEMVRSLQQVRIAHGDLQHGNVLVVNSALKLVDYDGMFVPTLSGKRSTELGQPNYQHPRRTEIDFGPELDSFSGWVIYVSLVALSIYPNLWQAFRGGDDCLLFRKRDFEDPNHSGVLKELEHCKSQSLRDLVEFFKIALYSSPSDVPTFDNVTPLANSVPAAGPAPSSPSWLQDHVVYQVAQSSPLRPATSSTDPSWVLDFIAPATVAPKFSGEAVLMRILLCGCAIGLPSALFFGWTSLVLLFACGVAAAVFVCVQRYRSDPVVQSRAQSHAALREVERELERARKAIEEVEARTRELRSVEAAQVDKLTREIQKVLADEKKQHDSADRTMRQATANALQQKQRLGQQEAEELTQLQSTLGSNVSSLAQQLAQSQQAEATERAIALKAKQEQHIQNRLQSLVLAPGAIPGIGSYVINNLIAAGIRTAADCNRLNYAKVPAVGQHRASAILAWRQAWEGRAKLTMPGALNSVEDDAIKAKYAASRAQIQLQLSDAQLSFATRKSSIQQKYATARVPLDLQTAVETAKHSSEVQRIQTDSKTRQGALQVATVRAGQNANHAIAEIEKPMGAQRKAVQSAQWRVAKARHESGRFRSITFRRYMRNVLIGR
jgi:hypothetical protein